MRNRVTKWCPFFSNGKMIFLLAYLFANIGALLVVIAFYNATGSDKIEDYAGLMKRSPAAAIIMTIFILSLVGIPPTAGFHSKYWLFFTAFVGLNLLQSAFTKWCLMEDILSALGIAKKSC